MSEIVLPPAPPEKILAMLEFYRSHREAVEPTLPVPQPEGVSETATVIWTTIWEQARDAAERGDAEVQVRIPVTQAVVAALRWRTEHEELFDQLMIGKLMVDDGEPAWEDNFALFKYFMHSAGQQASNAEGAGTSREAS